jgi:hypothetical protein
MNNKEFWEDMAKWGKRTNSLTQLELRDIYHVINVMEDDWHLEPSERASAEKIAENAFHNDTSPARYNPEAAKDAWTRTMALFGERLGS